MLVKYSSAKLSLGAQVIYIMIDGFMNIVTANFYRALYGRKTIYSTFPLRFLKRNIKSWSILFFGSDDFSLFSLKGLHENMWVKKDYYSQTVFLKHDLIKNLEVVVTNERNPVYRYAIANNIKCHFWPPNLNRAYDFGVIVSFGKLIPQNIIEQFPLGIINVHGSLLPKYRGGMPIGHAIKNGDTVTGITLCRIKPDKFDVGDIIMQRACCIDENEFMPSVCRRLSHLGWECLLEVIKNMPECLSTSIPQSDTDVSYAPKFSKEIAIVKWKDMTALEIFNLHRALYGTFELKSLWQSHPVKFFCFPMSKCESYILVNERGANLDPGSFEYNKKTKFLHVQCKDKSVAICSLKYKEKLHNASSFYSGYLRNLGKHLWKFES